MHRKLTILRYDRRVFILCLLSFKVFHGMPPSGWTPNTFYVPKDPISIMKLISRARAVKQDNPDSSLIYLNQALSRSRETGYADGIAFSLYGIGLAYSIKSLFDSSIEANKAAIFFCKQLEKHSDLRASIYSNIGHSYYLKGNYTLAISYFDSSVKTTSQNNLTKEGRSLAVTLNNIAAVHEKLNQWEQVLMYLNQAELICRKGNFDIQLMMTLTNKAAYYYSMNEDKRSEVYYKEALKLPFYKNHTESVAFLINAKSGFARLKIRQGKPKEALKLLHEIDIMDKTAYKETSSIAPAHLKGYAYLQLADYAMAETYLIQSLKESLAFNVFYNLSNIHKALSQLYDSTGNYKKALIHFYQYERIKDSLLSKEKIRDINDIDTKYRTAEKDRDIARQKLLINEQKDQLTKRNIWMVGMSIGVFFVLGMFVTRNRINRQKQESQIKEIQILKQQNDIHNRDQEIDHLKAIMQGEEKERIRIARDLHDGIVSQLLAIRLHFKGTLQDKRGYILESDDFNDTLHYLEEATKELRITAHNLMPETVLQNGFIAALQTYCSKMMEATSIRIEFQHLGYRQFLDPNIELSLYRIIQELVQNAIKHAQSDYVLVQVQELPHLLAITVEDNGVGCPDERIKSSAGMGLKSIFARVRVINAQLSVSSKQGVGTTFYIELEQNIEE